MTYVMKIACKQHKAITMATLAANVAAPDAQITTPLELWLQDIAKPNRTLPLGWRQHPRKIQKAIRRAARHHREEYDRHSCDIRADIRDAIDEVESGRGKKAMQFADWQAIFDRDEGTCDDSSSVGNGSSALGNLMQNEIQLRSELSLSRAGALSHNKWHESAEALLRELGDPHAPMPKKLPKEFFLILANIHANLKNEKTRLEKVNGRGRISIVGQEKYDIEVAVTYLDDDLLIASDDPKRIETIMNLYGVERRTIEGWRQHYKPIEKLQKCPFSLRIEMEQSGRRYSEFGRSHKAVGLRQSKRRP